MTVIPPSTATFKVKWNQKLFDNLSLEAFQTVLDLKKHLANLTGVLPAKQKLLLRGILKDAMQLNSLKLGAKDVIILVGTAEENHLQKPTETIIFAEDIEGYKDDYFIRSESKIIKDQPCWTIAPTGIYNQENCCYFNAIIQFLQPARGLVEAIRNYDLSSASLLKEKKKEQRLIANQRLFYQTWENSSITKDPRAMCAMFRDTFPQFAEFNKTENQFVQQDAEECLNCLFSMYNEYLQPGIVDKLFGFQVQSTLRPLETEDSNSQDVTKENESPREDTFRKLSCHCGTQRAPIYHMLDGVKLSLHENIEKFSTSLNRNVFYEKRSYLSSIPVHLLMHFVRFEWKQADQLSGTSACKAKICRRITFPIHLDVYDLCTAELKKELDKGRAIASHRRDIEFDAAHDESDPSKEKSESGSNVSTTQDISANASTLSETDNTGSTYYTGEYVLQSIVTHRGRAANSGHYIAWVRITDKEWLKYDDDKISEVAWEKIDLTGGRSDYHIAVLLLYSRVDIQAKDAEVQEALDKLKVVKISKV